MKTNIEELKRLAEAANKDHGGLPWQVTMTRTDGGTCYSIRGHSEPGIAVDRSDYWEDDHHPPGLILRVTSPPPTLPPCWS